jgi:peptidoglycan hydrolase CwlO-like protein
LATYRRKQIVVEADVDRLLDENVQESENGLKKLYNKIKKLQTQIASEKAYIQERLKPLPQDLDVLSKY